MKLSLENFGCDCSNMYVTLAEENILIITLSLQRQIFITYQYVHFISFFLIAFFTSGNNYLDALLWYINIAFFSSVFKGCACKLHNFTLAYCFFFKINYHYYFKHVIIHLVMSYSTVFNTSDLILLYCKMAFLLYVTKKAQLKRRVTNMLISCFE